MRATLGLVAVLAACGGDGLPSPGPAPATATPRRGGSVVVAQAEDLDSLDPLRSMAGLAVFLGPYLYDVLLDYPPATAADPSVLRPRLAESTTVSPDGLVYTFHLRAGIVYSDGRPVVADDFAYAVERAQQSPVAAFLQPVEAARAVDERTFEIRLRRPEPALPYILALRPFTPQRRGGDAAHPPGTGPFRVAEFLPGQHLVLERNPRYWEPGRPYLDRITIELMVPYDVAALRFLAGQSDLLMQPSADAFVRFARSPAWAPYVARVELVQSDALAINTRRPFLNDARVRQALNYAVNKDDVVRLMNGRATVSHGMLPPGMPGRDADRAPYACDPERARRLLAEAGVPAGTQLTYATMTGDMADRVALSIQADLTRVGLRVRLVRVHPLVLYKVMAQGDFDLAPTSWNMDFLDPWDFLELRFHSRMIDEGMNDSYYENPAIDALLDAAHVTAAGPERVARYRAIDRALYDEAPYVWLDHRAWVDVRRPRLEGYRPHSVWGPLLVDSWVNDGP